MFIKFVPALTIYYVLIYKYKNKNPCYKSSVREAN